MTVTEAIENLAAGKLSLTDCVAYLQARKWRVRPEGKDEAEAHQISDNWNDEGSLGELTEACLESAIVGDDRDRLLTAYEAAPDKVMLTLEQLISGDDPAQTGDWGGVPPTPTSDEPEDDKPADDEGAEPPADDEARKILDDEPT